jgi:homoserine kinase type II
MEHLSSQGLTCPTPVRDRTGCNLRELAGRPAALVTFLEGVWLRRPEPHHCRSVGEALARLHEAGRGYAISRRNALGPADWQPLFDRFRGFANRVTPDLAAVIEAELTAVLAAWPKGLPSGVIHGDLFPDNVFFRGDTLSGLIDFYFACNDLFAYDIAVCLNAWCFEPDVSFNRAKGQALLDGYQSVRPLLPAEQVALPTLARGAALRFLLTRAHDWVYTPADAMVVKHDPIPYLQRLQFHAGVVAKGSASTYGLEA